MFFIACLVLSRHRCCDAVGVDDDPAGAGVKGVIENELSSLGINLFLSIASGLKGYTPHFGNPAFIVPTFKAPSYAFLNMAVFLAHIYRLFICQRR